MNHAELIYDHTRVRAACMCVRHAHEACLSRARGRGGREGCKRLTHTHDTLSYVRFTCTRWRDGTRHHDGTRMSRVRTSRAHDACVSRVRTVCMASWRVRDGGGTSVRLTWHHGMRRHDTMTCGHDTHAMARAGGRGALTHAVQRGRYQRSPAAAGHAAHIPPKALRHLPPHLRPRLFV
jgi:hypothetical protein